MHHQVVINGFYGVCSPTGHMTPGTRESVSVVSSQVSKPSKPSLVGVNVAEQDTDVTTVPSSACLTQYKTHHPLRGTGSLDIRGSAPYEDRALYTKDKHYPQPLYMSPVQTRHTRLRLTLVLPRKAWHHYVPK